MYFHSLVTFSTVACIVSSGVRHFHVGFKLQAYGIPGNYLVTHLVKFERHEPSLANAHVSLNDIIQLSITVGLQHFEVDAYWCHYTC